MAKGILANEAPKRKKSPGRKRTLAASTPLFNLSFAARQLKATAAQAPDEPRSILITANGRLDSILEVADARR